MLFKKDKKIKRHETGFQIFYLNRMPYTVTALDRKQTFKMYGWSDYEIPYFLKPSVARDIIINNQDNMVVVRLFVRNNVIMTGRDESGNRCGMSKKALFDEVVYDPLNYDCHSIYYTQLLSITNSETFHKFYEKHKSRNIQYLHKNSLNKFANSITESDEHFSNFICYVDRLQPFSSKYNFFVKLLNILEQQGHTKILQYKDNFLQPKCQTVFKSIEQKVLKAKIPLQC